MKEFINKLIGYGSLKNADKEVIKGMYKVYENVDDFEYPNNKDFPSIDDKHKRRVINEAKADLKQFIVEKANEFIASKNVEVEEN